MSKTYIKHGDAEEVANFFRRQERGSQVPYINDLIDVFEKTIKAYEIAISEKKPDSHLMLDALISMTETFFGRSLEFMFRHITNNNDVLQITEEYLNRVAGLFQMELQMRFKEYEPKL